MVRHPNFCLMNLKNGTNDRKITFKSFLTIMDSIMADKVPTGLQISKKWENS